MAKVLGIHIGHDSTAALVIDGEIVASVSEERFNRVKHYAELPLEAIAYCLEEGKIAFDDLDEVALTSAWSQPEKLMQVMNLKLETLSQKDVEQRGDGLLERVIYLAREAYRSWRPGDNGEVPPLYFHRKWNSGRPVQGRRVEHHLAHAASAFYTSGLQEPTVVFTADGIGNRRSVCVWRASLPAQFELLYSEGGNGSLGWFYGLVTEGLGWWVGDGEGKTMGLAPYGNPDKAAGVLNKYCPHYENGRLVRPHTFGQVGAWLDTGTFHWHFPEAQEIYDLVQKHGREHIAAEAQRVLEREMIPFVQHWLKQEGTRKACFAGGLMLNVKMNQRLWESGALDVQHIFSEAGDAGLAPGAALYANAVLGGKVRSEPIRDVYWGPQYSDEYIEDLLKERGLRYTKASDVATAAAERLATGKIVGWFQGRMEAGPRALGARSILMDTSKAENKDIINARVKFREGFRPFCPSMTSKAAAELLDPRARTERFMITSFDVQPSQRHRIPAVVHADGTARPQVVDEKVNPLFHRLLVEFGKRSGTECLLNTSFNIKGEPIVCNPREAIRCFFDTGLDSLVLGSYILDKG
jgi:carbamoyltransferase